MRVLLKFIPRKYHYHVGYAVGKLQALKGRG